jgi:hypothetical protein
MNIFPPLSIQVISLGMTPINHQPFTMDNCLNTWAHLLYVVHQQPVGFSAQDKNVLHIFELLQSQIVQECTNIQSTFHTTIHRHFLNIGQMR